MESNKTVELACSNFLDCKWCGNATDCEEHLICPECGEKAEGIMQVYSKMRERAMEKFRLKLE